MKDARSEVIVRRARAGDKPAVVEFCSQIWEGWDYLPRVYDRWLEDPRGAFLVAELDGRPVGTDKITVLSPGQIWLEGLRVDPKAQGRGVALAINRRAMEIIAGLDPRTVRFGTVADNWASRHMGEKDGFRLIFECRRMVAGPPEEKPDQKVAQETAAGPVTGSNKGSSPGIACGPDEHSSSGTAVGPARGSPPQLAVEPEDLDAVRAFLEGSENYRRQRGLYGWGWTFQEMSREFIEQILAREGALAIREGGRIETLALFLPQRHGPRFCLGFIDGRREGMTELAGRFQEIAVRRGAAGVFAMIPGSAVEALSGAGFHQEYPVEIVVYELSGAHLEAAMRKVSGG
jgi:hypothetical protein